MDRAVVEQVWRIADPLVTGEGMEIVDIEYRREGHGTVLRFYIDREGGVTLDDLTPVSRRLGHVLEAESAVPGAYTLEVSSPGINRRLRQPDHFRRYIGKRVRVRTVAPCAGRRSFVGSLDAVEANGIVIGLDNSGTQFVEFENIAQANYEHQFDAQAKQRRVTRTEPR